ncbi:hypothetical protein BKA69DRAFT_1045552 [Paraphysoderma sedebokerense]|nr:hypothetical protein BKA69DRAFT_1045552 [Paraphysoderma sedebokerense]
MSEKANIKKSRKRKSDELDARESSKPRQKPEKQEAFKSVDIRKWFGSNNTRESRPHDKGKETTQCEERQVSASGSIETNAADAMPNPKLELGRTEVVILSDSDEEDIGNTPGLLSKDDKFVQCPVCSVHVLSEEINSHLDRCL